MYYRLLLIVNCRQTRQHVTNTLALFHDPEHSKIVSGHQFEWARSMARNHSRDPYWINVGHIVAQFDGLYHGYTQASSRDWGTMIVYILRCAVFHLRRGGHFFPVGPTVRWNPRSLKPCKRILVKCFFFFGRMGMTQGGSVLFTFWKRSGYFCGCWIIRPPGTVVPGGLMFYR